MKDARPNIFPSDSVFRPRRRSFIDSAVNCLICLPVILAIESVGIVGDLVARVRGNR